MSTLEIIVEDLKALPAPKLAEAAAFIHRLRENSRADRDKILRETSGVWREDGEFIEKTIQEDCERIDARDW